MFSHIMLGTNDVNRAKSFYDALIGALGGSSDHGTTKSLYAKDPDGLEFEVVWLIPAHLITEHQPGRFAFHDLLRAYAADLAHHADPAEERHAAAVRLLDHYLHTAHAAAQLLMAARDSAILPPAQPGTTPEQPSTAQQALGNVAADSDAFCWA